ncbi:hypothetical protein ACFPES_07115 [Paenibacillus sp. GCM10023248]|uniref:hypothetical protein n=1 Tax=unclassified Paenibacillus TaxID=185978 RepID=UPI002378CE08|nr:hypothetical protein [Paenibacillus sp. MAHUQ-63]MDD9266801.1 hypothetical protein [Paenibacillus sp. MAHUQ-63]
MRSILLLWHYPVGSGIFLLTSGTALVQPSVGQMPEVLGHYPVGSGSYPLSSDTAWSILQSVTHPKSWATIPLAQASSC